MMKHIKKAFRGSKVSLNQQPVAKEPRELNVIQQEFGQKCAQLGELTYKADIDKEMIAVLKEDIKSLNHEGAARKSLDTEKAKATTASTANNPQAQAVSGQQNAQAPGSKL